MNRKLKYTLGALVALGIACKVLAQTGIVPTSFSGNEVWPVAIQGPGGTSEFVTSAMIRNTTGGFIQTATNTTMTWPGSPSSSGAQYSTIVYTGQIGTATQQLPASPFDGQLVELVNGSTTGAMTSLTVTVTDSTSTTNFGSALTLATGASAQFYFLKAGGWFRMR